MDNLEENLIPMIEDEKYEIENSLNYSLLQAEEKERVDKIVEAMDVSDTSAIMSYASGVQGKMASFSDNILQNIKSVKAGEAGDILSSLVARINDFDAASVNSKPSIITKLLKRAEGTADKLIEKYSKIESDVDKILLALEKSKIQMKKDIAVFEHMYEENLKFFKELSLYIIAGDMKIKYLKETEIPKLKKIADESKAQIDIQAANDVYDICNKLEGRIHDLKLTRIISIQMAPQIRMMQENEFVLAEKIRSAIVNMIPLWKSQLLLALGVAREFERSAINVEALRQNNTNIISTIEEVISIYREGEKMRSEAEQELLGVERERKEKLKEV